MLLSSSLNMELSSAYNHHSITDNLHYKGWSNKVMDQLKFNYNKPDASCHFCNRTENPHPDFDEPIVTAKLAANNQEIEVCINCYCELEASAKVGNQPFSQLVTEKLNVLRILSKSQK
jgi:hypothetical protein